MTDAQLIELGEADALTPEQTEQYCIRILGMHPAVAKELAYTNWDQFDQNIKSGKGPII